MPAGHAPVFASPAVFRDGPISQAQKPAPSKGVTHAKSSKKHLPTDTVGLVNGTVITYQDFREVMRGYLQAYVAETKATVVSDSVFSRLVDSSWQRILSDIIIDQEIAKRGLTLSDSAVRDSLVVSPPPLIREHFTDSVTHRYYPEVFRAAMLDSRNDSLMAMIVGAEHLRLETERLIDDVVRTETLAHAADKKRRRTPPSRERIFEAWLHRMILAAHVTDRRSTFGFY